MLYVPPDRLSASRDNEHHGSEQDPLEEREYITTYQRPFMPPVAL